MLNACYFEVHSAETGPRGAHRIQISFVLDSDSPGYFDLKYRDQRIGSTRASWRTVTPSSTNVIWRQNEHPMALNMFAAVMTGALSQGEDRCYPRTPDEHPFMALRETARAALARGYVTMLPVVYMSIPATNVNYDKLNKRDTAPWPVINRAKNAYRKLGIEF